MFDATLMTPFPPAPMNGSVSESSPERMTNSAGKTGWTPPCPPEGDDPHHYVFTLYALKDKSRLPDGAEPDEVRAKLAGAIARGTFTGTYARATSR